MINHLLDTRVSAQVRQALLHLLIIQSAENSMPNLTNESPFSVSAIDVQAKSSYC